MAHGMRAERPEPRSVAVELEVRPVVAGLDAIHGVASVEVLGGFDRLARLMSLDERGDALPPAHENPGTPFKERFRRFDVAGTAHRVRDERPVAEPAEAVDREGRRRDVRTGRCLVRTDHAHAVPGECLEPGAFDRAQVG